MTASESGGKRHLLRMRRLGARDRVAVAVLPQLYVVLGRGSHHRRRVWSQVAHAGVQTAVVLQHCQMLLLLLKQLLLSQLLWQLVPGVHERGLAQVDHALLSRRQSSRRGKSGSKASGHFPGFAN